MTWPTKTDFVDGDVLTAAQVNNIGTNLNVFDPTSATSGQVPIANGTGSAAWGAVPADAFTLISSGALSGSSYAISSIPGTYKHLFLILDAVKFTSGSRFLQIYPTGLSATTYSLRNQGYYQTGSTQTAIGTYWADASTTGASGYGASMAMWIYDYASTSLNNKMAWAVFANELSPGSVPNGQAWTNLVGHAHQTTPAAITGLTITNSGPVTQTGNWRLYGVK